MGNQYSDSATLKLQRALFSADTTGKTTVVAAPGANKRLRIHGFLMSAKSAVGAVFYAGTTGSSLSGTHVMNDWGHIGEPVSEFPVMDDLPTNVPLTIGLDAERTVGGIVHYHIVKALPSTT